MDIGIVGLLIDDLLRVLCGKEQAVAFLAGLFLNVRVAYPVFLRDAEHLADGRFGHVVGVRDFGL